MSVQCPNGSKCRVWNETRFTYCEYSCAFDNGGCDPGRRCIEENVPTCSSDQCCSPVNVTCLPPDNGSMLQLRMFMHCYIKFLISK